MLLVPRNMDTTVNETVKKLSDRFPFICLQDNTATAFYKQRDLEEN